MRTTSLPTRQRALSETPAAWRRNGTQTVTGTGSPYGRGWNPGGFSLLGYRRSPPWPTPMWRWTLPSPHLTWRSGVPQTSTAYPTPRRTSKLSVTAGPPGSEPHREECDREAGSASGRLPAGGRPASTPGPRLRARFTRLATVGACRRYAGPGHTRPRHTRTVPPCRPKGTRWSPDRRHGKQTRLGCSNCAAGTGPGGPLRLHYPPVGIRAQ